MDTIEPGKIDFKSLSSAVSRRQSDPCRMQTWRVTSRGDNLCTATRQPADMPRFISDIHTFGLLVAVARSSGNDEVRCRETKASSHSKTVGIRPGTCMYISDAHDAA